MNSKRSNGRCRSRGRAPGWGEPRGDSRYCGHRGQRGVALITVTLLLALMTLLAGAALGIARTSAKLAANHLTIASAEVLADSAIRGAILSLIADDSRRRWAVGGSSTAFSFHGGTVNVRILDESGRIDLNGADAALLAAAFAANGMSEKEARAVADRLIDWRDPDDALGTSGAERLEYRQRGLGYGPRNGPFESPDEVWLVLGMPVDRRAKLEVLFTVYTGQSGVNETAASPDVLTVLKWADARQWGGRRWLAETPAAPGDLSQPMTGRVVRITAESSGDAPAAQPVVREAIVRLTGNRHEPTIVHSWTTSYAVMARHSTST